MPGTAALFWESLVGEWEGEIHSPLFTTDHCLALAPQGLRHIKLPFAGGLGWGQFWGQVIAPGENPPRPVQG